MHVIKNFYRRNIKYRLYWTRKSGIKYLFVSGTCLNNKTKKERRKKRYPLHLLRVSRAKRKRIYERDKYECVLCDSKENLTIDHIKPIALGGKSIDSNLRTLCFDCHQEKNKKDEPLSPPAPLHP